VRLFFKFNPYKLCQLTDFNGSEGFGGTDGRVSPPRLLIIPPPLDPGTPVPAVEGNIEGVGLRP